MSKKEIIEPAQSQKEIRKKENTQIKFVIGISITMILAFLVTFWIIHNLNNFEYNGLKFQRTKGENNEYYTTYIPKTRGDGEIYSEYQWVLFNNPKNLEKINTQIYNGIEFYKKTIYITLPVNVSFCEYNILAPVKLQSFLTEFAGYRTEGAVLDKNYSLENEINYITCENTPGNTVIKLIEGNKTYIQRTGDNCYVLSYTNCEINEVVERFEMELVKEYLESKKL